MLLAVSASGSTAPDGIEVEDVLTTVADVDGPVCADGEERSGHSAYAAPPPITSADTAPTAIQGHGEDFTCTTGV
jgi:hypothetical protein